MTLDEARDRIGQKVIYRPRPGAPAEEGVITEIRDKTVPLVMVRYGSDTWSKATRPQDLEPLSGGAR